MYKVKCGDAAA